MSPISHPESAINSDTEAKTPVISYPKVRPVHSVQETEEAWEVTVELPGVAKSDIELRSENHQLVLEGTTQIAPSTWEAIRAERSPVTFTLRLQFPANVALHEANAKSDHGVLTIRVPKPQAAQTVSIQIQ